ncbi:MAG: sialate O-acetylesterase [Bacteroidota bacterium]
MEILRKLSARWMVIGLIWVSWGVRADVQLPALFSDNMVLQQQANARFWGTANPNESIRITASWGTETTVLADCQGDWAVEIATPKGSHTPQQLVFNGENEIVLRNVLIGEVWLCSGQSNMGWSVKQSNNAYQEILNAQYPLIRFFEVPRNMAWAPQDHVDARWEACSPETVVNTSAVAYFFGRYLQEKLDVPVGLIISAWGGSGAQAWISKEAASAEGQKDIVDWYDTYEPQMKEQRSQWIKEVGAWRAQQPEGKPMDYGTRPSRNKLPGDNHIPFGLYNAMIHPLKSYAIKGALWYQGESNVSRAHQYRTLFPAMIKSWRDAWGQGDFPFYFVQLAPYHYNDIKGVNSAELRDAQLRTLENTVNTGMVVTTDIGDALDIHPRKKQEVGYRLALLALHDYGRLSEGFSSPLYDSYEVQGQSVFVTFKHAKELGAKRGNRLVGFTIAGKDQKFVPAQAEIVNGNQVRVWSSQVKRPVAVRYGWSNAPFLNLFNAAGLPLSPFKTDSWKDTTEGNIHLDYP